MPYILAFIALAIMFVTIDVLATGRHSISRRARQISKNKNQLIERVGISFAIVGVIGIFVGGLWTKDLIAETQDKAHSIYRAIDTESQNIEPVKFAHYYALATDKNYVGSAEFNSYEKRIADYTKLRRQDREAIEEDKRRIDRQLEMFAFSCSVTFILISVFTVNLGAGLISRSMWERIEACYKDENKATS
jgi:hypothetical protein